MLEKLKENKKTVIIILIVIGGILAWWQSRDTEETPVDSPMQEQIINEEN